MRELLRIGGMNVYDLLEEHFDSPLLKGALGFDAVLGANFGPRSPGTVLTLLYRLAAASRRPAAVCRNRAGGMGALCDALAKAAAARGRADPHRARRWRASWSRTIARPASMLESRRAHRARPR